ncbi:MULTISPECIES: aminotransferase-like domain-containing protein [unclassified Microbacterium]|uniref:aminotransferase-like domain-containing protein n=1 Tax=unclassified Microbacterium TaxID=2609290 RepID=UPI00097EC963|nr:PLP-dependent aminotransferase family protein [Microbacterium sp. JB110]RCS62883.1 PLP-dependent aminotransferase family protein [Microbacterium sp. JB110]SJM61780.1 Transcriptional regulator, GntR family domain / Aspartate aminotransferase [Frigoribacterium sp. JB110]
MKHDSSVRIVDDLRGWIASAAPGARLPSTRDLARRHAASPVTVQRALRSLVTLGLIETRPGAGAFVRSVRRAHSQDFGWQTAALGSPERGLPSVLAAQRSSSAEVIELSSGYPDSELLPERLVRSALIRAARSEAATVRQSPAGMPELRSWFAAELGGSVPTALAAPSAKDVIITPGSQIALGSLFRSIAGRGGVLLIESPTYWGAILAASQAGVTLHPVPSGPEGPDPDALDRAFAETGARGLYAQPTFANPTGAQWTPSRASAVLDVVRARGAFLIEDDWAHDFGITSEPSPIAAQDDAGHVVYVRSLTKSVSPAIRVAAVVARGPLRERVLADLQAQTMYVSGVLQAAALDVVTQPAWRTHLRGLRDQLASRRDLLIDAVRAHLPDVSIDLVPPGGLHLWVRLDDGTDLPELVRRCEARGVIIASGDDWFPAESTARYLRLGFAGRDAGSYDAAARIIGESLA